MREKEKAKFEIKSPNKTNSSHWDKREEVQN